MGKIILVSGGASSGKSEFALSFGQAMAGEKIFIATSRALDDEMREKISRHKQARCDTWKTFEAGSDKRGALLRETLLGILGKKDEPDIVFLIDCMTMWLSGIIMDSESGLESVSERRNVSAAVSTGVNNLLNVMLQAQSTFILVTNELGLGIVPENRLARFFRISAGEMNKKLAKRADEFYMIFCGVPLKIK